MSVVATEGEVLEPGHQGGHDAGEHVSPAQRDRRERLALYLFIGGDAVFAMLEIFTWFYLRALNTNGMWRGAACTAKAPCTDGLGNPITHEIAKANPAFTLVIAALAVVTAISVWGVESAARRGGQRSPMQGFALLSLLVVLGAIVVQCLQFGHLPFQTIDGAYPSVFEFLMGSTLVHLLLLAFLIVGLTSRVRLGKYDEGRYYQTRLVRMFATWIAISTVVLALVMSFGS